MDWTALLCNLWKRAEKDLDQDPFINHLLMAQLL